MLCRTRVRMAIGAAIRAALAPSLWSVSSNLDFCLALGASLGPGNVAYVTDLHKWLIHRERPVDDTPHVRVSPADASSESHCSWAVTAALIA